MAHPVGHPIVRVRDAGLVPDAGPARLVVSDLPEAEAIAVAVVAAHGTAEVRAGRLHTTTTPSRLAAAAGRVGGVLLAEAMARATDRAIAAWLAGAPDWPTPAAVLPTGSRPVVMGVLNVTPDSFSDGGTHLGDDHPERAIAAGHALAVAGADILDVGGESTRPGAEPVPPDEELRRVIPVVEALAADGLVVSIDTTKAVVAEEAVNAGAAIVNDVSAGSLDEALLPTVARLGVPYVLMHMRGTPRTMQDEPHYDDVVAEVTEFLAHGLARLDDAGIPPERVAVDPGIGFGKTPAHNLALLRATRELTSLGRPVVIGTSRKSFIGALTGDAASDDRLEGSLVTAADAVVRGAAIVRVHDVAATVRAVTVAAALRD